MCAQRRNLHDAPAFIPSESNQEEEEKDSNPFASSTEEDRDRLRRNRRAPNHFQDFKVEIPKFESHLDPDEFLEWLQNSWKGVWVEGCTLRKERIVSGPQAKEVCFLMMEKCGQEQS